MTTGLSPSSKSPLPVRPMISTINSTNINLTHKPNLTINTNYNNYTETKDFLKPQKLSFNSYSDLSYNNPEKIHRRYNSEYNIHNNTYADIKRNDTKMQMMEEKMKNLELKSQRLEVINDFFFDMFENNLVKEEINKQRENAAKLQKQKNKEEGYEVSSSSESDSFIMLFLFAIIVFTIFFNNAFVSPSSPKENEKHSSPSVSNSSAKAAIFSSSIGACPS